MFEGEQLYSTADPVVRLYRKYGTEDFHQDGIILVDSTTEDDHTFNIPSTRCGEIFLCSLSDVNTYNSSETVFDGNHDGNATIYSKSKIRMIIFAPNFILLTVMTQLAT